MLEALGHVDWLTLVIGIILGMPVAYIIGVLAHMHTPRVVQFLDRRKLLKTHKTRQQALKMFSRIEAFRNGTSDKYNFYILLASSAIVCAILASTLILIISIQVHEYPVPIEYGFVAVLAALAMSLTLILLAGIYETGRRIERFDDYKKEFEERWGPIDEGKPKS
jgi:membrane protein DedA with SNARE-associated domain